MKDSAFMRRFFGRVFGSLFGDSRIFQLEHRLFNTISLLNAVANFGGAITLRMMANTQYLLFLQLASGLLFLAFYLLSRFRGQYRQLYWPLIILMLVFLFANTLGNAGSSGGAHYYFIPALSIAIILSNRIGTTITVMALFCVVAGIPFLLEQIRPEWITQYANPTDRLIDVSSNFLFVQIFTGILIVVLTKNLNQERAKSDKLLLNILPEEVAAELKRDDFVKPLHYDNASVLFTDMVGFTQISEKLSPQELIAELDCCFSFFDQVVKRNNLEKIKTIGDAYMAVGGIPVSNNSHAVDCVNAALEIQAYMQRMMETREAANQPHWQLRLGINSGPLVAGVIGREKFAYDVWGDTVNTASRFESAGAAGQVNISQTTFEQVKDHFDCEYRGKITAKGKGEVEMYFVNRLKPEAAVSH
jgi:adenylate cyclase